MASDEKGWFIWRFCHYRIGSGRHRSESGRPAEPPPGGARNDRYPVIRDHPRRGLVPSRLVNPEASPLCRDRCESTIIYRPGSPGARA
jgi:hypothetical protein